MTGRSWWWVALVALAGSSVVELVQWRWLERDGSWGDVVANTVGALVGALAVTLRCASRITTSWSTQVARRRS